MEFDEIYSGRELYIDTTLGPGVKVPQEDMEWWINANAEELTQYLKVPEVESLKREIQRLKDELDSKNQALLCVAYGGKI